MAPKYLANGVHKDAKRCVLADELSRFQSTHSKPMNLWTPQEVITWLCDEAFKNGLNHEKIHLNGFHCVDGSTLLKLTQREFVQKAAASGHSLYHIVCQYKRKQLRFLHESKASEKSRNEYLCPLNITAVGKKSPFSVDVIEENNHEKPARQWASEEVAIWLCKEALKYGYDHEKICLTNFHGVNGKHLLNMGKNDFIKNINSSFELGCLLYKSVDELKRSNGKSPSNCTARSPGKLKTKTGDPHVIRRKGRERSYKREQLWIFILNLLKNPQHSDLICWENREEGLFRIVDSRKLAGLWGTRGGKTGMNFEKFSRAMRYYYKKRILLSVTEKLIYQFGPASWGWKSEDSTQYNDSLGRVCRK